MNYQRIQQDTMDYMSWLTIYEKSTERYSLSQTEVKKEYLYVERNIVKELEIVFRRGHWDVQIDIKSLYNVDKRQVKNSIAKVFLNEDLRCRIRFSTHPKTYTVAKLLLCGHNDKESEIATLPRDVVNLIALALSNK